MTSYTGFLAQSSIRERSREARNPSNRRGHCDRRRCWTAQGSPVRFETAQRKHLPHSSSRVPCGLREGIPDLQPHPKALKNGIIGRARFQERLTNLIRATPGGLGNRMNLVRVTFDTQLSKMICKGLVVTPMKGIMFGWFSLFHATASLKNDCDARRRS